MDAKQTSHDAGAPWRPCVYRDFKIREFALSTTEVSREAR